MQEKTPPSLSTDWTRESISDNSLIWPSPVILWTARRGSQVWLSVVTKTAPLIPLSQTATSAILNVGKGMEAVGVFLAVLPLVVSAVEHFDDCLERLQRFIRPSTELRCFQHDLAIEKQRFMNECSIILLSALDWEQGIDNSDHGVGAKAQVLTAVDNMFRNKNSPLWDNENLERRIQDQLGSSAELISALIDEINSILRGLRTDSLAFETAIGHAANPGFLLEKFQIKTRLKVAFSHAHLDKLRRLERANNKFRELNEQSVQIMDSVRRHGGPKSTSNPSALERYRRIQRASYEVYQTLTTLCCEHSEHMTRLCLEVESDHSGDDGPVIFRLAFGKHTFVWVKTASDANVASEQIANGVQNLLSQVAKQLTQEEDATGQDAHSNALQPLPVAPTSSSERDRAEHGRVYTLSGLCAQIGPCSQPRTSSEDDVLFPEAPEPADDGVCVDPPSPPAPTTLPERSLHDLLNGLAAEGPVGRLSRFVQFHLARLLTTAVLQYYRTPWLRAWWRSSDIFFADADAAALAGHDPAKARLAAPHIAVRVRDLLIAPPSRTSTFPLQDVARNPVLYGLGILLIELAYSRPISALLTPDDAKRGPALAEWLAAKRLAAILGEQMGPVYGRIVRHCLYCDFGCAEDDLNNAELQAAYYTNVVHELEVIDAEMQALYHTFHITFLDYLVGSWIDYIEYLLDQLHQHDTKAQYSNIDHAEKSAYAVSHHNLQDLHALQAKIERAHHCVQSCINIGQYCQSRTSNDCETGGIPNLTSCFKHSNAMFAYITTMTHHATQLDRLHIRLLNIQGLLSPILIHRNSLLLQTSNHSSANSLAALLDFTTESKAQRDILTSLLGKSQAESTLLKALSVVTTICMPAGLIANVFSSSLIQSIPVSPSTAGAANEKVAKEHLTLSTQFWIYVAISVPLMLVTMLWTLFLDRRAHQKADQAILAYQKGERKEKGERLKCD